MSEIEDMVSRLREQSTGPDSIFARAADEIERLSQHLFERDAVIEGMMETINLREAQLAQEIKNWKARNRSACEAEQEVVRLNSLINDIHDIATNPEMSELTALLEIRALCSDLLPIPAVRAVTQTTAAIGMPDFDGANLADATRHLLTVCSWCGSKERCDASECGFADPF